MSELLAAALAVLDALPTTPEVIGAGDTAELTCRLAILDAHVANYRAELIVVGDRGFERLGSAGAVIAVAEYTRALIPVMHSKPDDFCAKVRAGQTRGFCEKVRAVVGCEVRRLEEYLASKAPVGDSRQFVTLDQAAASVSRSKRTLEKLFRRRKNPFPDPDIQGGGGKPNEWAWERIRPWLEAEYARKLPAVFPKQR